MVAGVAGVADVVAGSAGLVWIMLFRSILLGKYGSMIVYFGWEDEEGFPQGREHLDTYW